TDLPILRVTIHQGSTPNDEPIGGLLALHVADEKTEDGQESPLLGFDLLPLVDEDGDVLEVPESGRLIDPDESIDLQGQAVVLDRPVEDERDPPLQAGEVDSDASQWLAAIPGSHLHLGPLERFDPDLLHQRLVVRWRAGSPGQLEVALAPA